jgi:hypothetical protein
LNFRRKIVEHDIAIGKPHDEHEMALTRLSLDDGVSQRALRSTPGDQRVLLGDRVIIAVAGGGRDGLARHQRFGCSRVTLVRSAVGRPNASSTLHVQIHTSSVDPNGNGASTKTPTAIKCEIRRTRPRFSGLFREL